VNRHRSEKQSEERDSRRILYKVFISIISIVRKMAHRFEIVRELHRVYRRFGATGMQFTVRLNPPTDLDLNPVDDFLASMDDVFEHVLQGVQDSDMVGIAIRKCEP
jgi:hypothetical protein